ncbi:Polyketide cyclase / dehydrase and lipid transport [Pseudomonas sp. ok272]|uniref:SRPBCC family protein n=1 Tax=unclassified Pseudomonas TaxID=196821 RepID=UPI0008B72065|nr:MULTISPECIES: SRPBCC family protein [unclassified Pseudomonas]SEN64866.1 Polyketide cyclase / dehydrase and lipid transport [Pseudomonas sp. ok272]SFN43824.1 Polyketide cyclase / dehydrase and lipid transport [Pseudomonas sp. ok602]
MSTLQPDTLINNPHGCHVVSAVTVPAPAAQVWAVVGNFSGFHRFIPALSHIEMIGDGVASLRVKFFKDGNRVVEQLNARDDQALNMTWTLIYNTLGIGNLWAAMHVDVLAEDLCRVTWTIIAQPTAGGADMPTFQGFLQGFADEAMGNVRQMFV